jgi:hypothetical protein
VSTLADGIIPLANLVLVFGGVLYGSRRLRRQAPEIADLFAVWVSPLGWLAAWFGWIPLVRWSEGGGIEFFLRGFESLARPDAVIAGFCGAGFGYLQARCACQATSRSVRWAARIETVFFGALLLLLLTLSLWERFDWWREHS